MGSSAVGADSCMPGGCYSSNSSSCSVVVVVVAFAAAAVDVGDVIVVAGQP